MLGKMKGAAMSPARSDVLEKAADPALFRTAVRSWVEATVKADRTVFSGRAGDIFYDRQQWWMAERNKVGLGTPHWPEAYGGADLSLKNQIILAEEMARAGAPVMSLFTVSLNHVPATLIRWGTEEQKTRYLPGVAKGVVWCQGFSEPGAGSDLASLRTRAVRDGDSYIINGQKIWSSYSMFAEYCILLTRTDPNVKKQAGITYFIMDMKSKGVEVRPLRQANGGAGFAEVFLTDVRIPVENRVGKENEGWTVAQSTLSAERGILVFESGERLRYVMEEFYADALRNAADWLRDSEMTREFVRLFAEMQGCRQLLRRLLRENEANAPSAFETVIYVKIISTTLRKKIGDFMLRTKGLGGQFHTQSFDEMTSDPMNIYIGSFAGTIAGGSNEIMRNVLAEKVLKMPRS
ncbi:MAG: acyl-CoA dehydrogenase [Rhodospirillaceae bacterium]|nr:MAG: acyl-CoA dehydrogenase [Rhodospirillaceae bacterium]